MSGLTAFQLEVARVFFSLPASEGFLLGGGAALLASDLTTRPTHDLDFFGVRDHVDIAAAREAFEATAQTRGWEVTRRHDHEAFVRLIVRGDDAVSIDLALDVPPGRPPVVTIAGPAFDPEELAGRKLIALFDRAEARDFVDVYLLAQRFGQDTLMSRATEIDAGFSTTVLASMMQTLERFEDHELPIQQAEVPALRASYHAWTQTLATDTQ